MKRYFGEWTDFENFGGWDSRRPLPDDLTDEQILFAAYDVDGCEGSAYVLCLIEGKLFEVVTCHCSCNGLSWDQEETTIEALKMRPKDFSPCYSRENDEAARAYREIVEELVRDAETPRVVRHIRRSK